MPKIMPTDPQNLTRMNPGAAALDIGSTMHMAAVNRESDDMPIRAFGTFTHDLHDLATWFRCCGVTSVAMGSTGVYWIPAFEILEQHGFEVILVNARYTKMCRAGRPMSVMRRGFANYIPTACCAEAFVRRHRLLRCEPIYDSESD